MMIIATACMQVYVSVQVKFYFLLHNLFERSQDCMFSKCTFNNLYCSV